jgi:hypothetical protein
MDYKVVVPHPAGFQNTHARVSSVFLTEDISHAQGNAYLAPPMQKPGVLPPGFQKQGSFCQSI